MFSFIRKNSFILLLLLLFVLSDLLISRWDPMAHSRRFYKNDFTKTLFHHNWQDTGPVFFGNSAVTASYIEEQSTHKLTEFGLSYGKITDLKQILAHPWYHVESELVVGIDVHTMMDAMETDPTYQWHKKWYQPYIYAYRDYFRDSGKEFARNLYAGVVELNRDKLLAYEPRWIDKELYYGNQSDQWLQDKWDDYDKRFGWMTTEDFRGNLDALEWVVKYAAAHDLHLKVVWMPWNKAYPLPPYMPALKDEANRILAAGNVPVFDVMDRYDPKLFHDLVHLNRHDGAPIFTREVDAWLNSFASSAKP
ncbi:MAG: hypothetical protein J7639_01005 [Paenibacillaceae bacterium]|nr:hypothetical protein [Paenibacillaceae bacterium]